MKKLWEFVLVNYCGLKSARGTIIGKEKGKGKCVRAFCVLEITWKEGRKEGRRKE